MCLRVLIALMWGGLRVFLDYYVVYGLGWLCCYCCGCELARSRCFVGWRVSIMLGLFLLSCVVLVFA